MSKTIVINHIPQVVTNARLWKTDIDRNIFIATKENIKDIINIEHICFNPIYYDSLLTESSIKYIITAGNSLLIINKFGEKIAGYAQISFNKSLPSARFYSLAVLPEFQGKAAANLLFRSVERISQIIGANAILLEIREDNKALRYRYTKIGYVQYKVIKNYYPDGCSAIKMRKKLP